VAPAQANGFAEADPSLDIGGHDAMQKLKILAGLAFSEPVRRTTVVGLAECQKDGWRAARAAGSLDDAPDDKTSGYVIRQVAEARRVAGGVELVVENRRLPASDPLASVRDEQNAVAIRGRAVGEIWLSGRGAGSLPTAAALLGDILNLT
jgi:homoserine dehydrogenase